MGNTKIQTLVHKKINEINVQEVLKIPGAAANLLSVSKIVEKGHTVTFSVKGCTVTSPEGEILAEANLENGIYKVIMSEIKAMVSSNVVSNAILWHRRLGHLNRKGMSLLKNLATGYNLQYNTNETCLECIKGKHARHHSNLVEREPKMYWN